MNWNFPLNVMSKQVKPGFTNYQPRGLDKSNLYEVTKTKKYRDNIQKIPFSKYLDKSKNLKIA